MLSEAHLTSYSRMSGSVWVTALLWLPGSLISFVYSCSVCFFHLFLIFSVLLGPYQFCPLSCPSLCEMFPWYFQFSWRDLLPFPFSCFPLLICIVYRRMPSYLSLLFSEIPHLVGYIFPFSSLVFRFSSFLSCL